MYHLKSKIIALENKLRAHERAIQIMRTEARERFKAGHTNACVDESIDALTLQVRRLEYAFYYSCELEDYATALKAQRAINELLGLYRNDEKKIINIEYVKHDT